MVTAQLSTQDRIPTAIVVVTSVQRRETTIHTGTPPHGEWVEAASWIMHEFFNSIQCLLNLAISLSGMYVFIALYYKFPYCLFACRTLLFSLTTWPSVPNSHRKVLMSSHAVLARSPIRLHPRVSGSGRTGTTKTTASVMEVSDPSRNHNKLPQVDSYNFGNLLFTVY